MSFAHRLHQAIASRGTPALVGIDPRWDWLPTEIRRKAISLQRNIRETTALAFEAFSRELIEIVGPLVPAVKPQIAFFEQLGAAGFNALWSVMSAARKAGLIVIADAKRGDIGTTAEAYASAWLAGDDPDRAAWPADALTVNPYMGSDTLEPFVRLALERSAGVYVLVRTSNPGAAEFQEAVCSDATGKNCTLYEFVANRVQAFAESSRGESDVLGSVGAVVGATAPRQLAELRIRMPAVPFLIPGYGAQGGSSADTAPAFLPSGLGAIVNSSRGINFPWLRKPYSEEFGENRWREAIEAATREMIADLAINTPAGQLRPAV